MTMPEMARLLLIPRKEVYNILLTGRDKDQFEFVYIADRRRVTKDSFERWYVRLRKQYGSDRALHLTNHRQYEAQ